MAYEILYNRAFIRADNKFIPIIQHGSNNCFDYSSHWRCPNRLIPEKVWSLLNLPHPKQDKVLLSESEVVELAEFYSKEPPYKTRYTPFEKEEYKRWLINGMNSARTTEEYVKHGNHLYIVDWSDWDNKTYYNDIKTTDELLSTIDKLQGKKINISFKERDLTLPKRKYTRRKKELHDTCYVLTTQDESSYFLRLLKHGYKYAYCSRGAKKFKNKRDAEKYIDKYSNRIPKYSVIKKIEGEFYL